jgi:hypothetical protein
MLLDKEIKLDIKSSRIIYELNKLGISSKIGDIIYLPMEKLWKNSNYKVNVKCDICGIEKKLIYAIYNENIKKYNIYSCSNKCSHFKNKMTNLKKYGLENYVNPDKAKKTKLEKYGDENYQNTKKIKETKLEKYGDENYNNRDKYKETNIKKYGMENIFQVSKFKEKTKITNLERYGVEDSRSSKFVKDKRKKTNLERYGNECYNRTEECKLKIKETSIRKYGLDSPNKSPLVKDKKVQAMLKKYGYISNSLTEECKKKLRNTNIERYGVEYPMQVEEFALKQQKNAHKIEYFNYDLYYQGSYEKDFLRHIDNLGLLFLVSRGKMIKYNFEDKTKMHFPDFFIESLNLIVEIKSSYYYNKFIEKNKAKMSACVDMGYNYIFIINKNYSVIDFLINQLMKLI